MVRGSTCLFVWNGSRFALIKSSDTTWWILLMLQMLQAHFLWVSLRYSHYIFHWTSQSDGNNCKSWSFGHKSSNFQLNWIDDCIYSADAINRIKYAHSKGHQIGSHTWSHYDLSTLTWDQSMFGQIYKSIPFLIVLFLVHDEMWRVECT